MRKIAIISCLMVAGAGLNASAATLPADVAKWASENRAVVNSTSGCAFSRGTPYCETQEGVDRLTALYKAAKK